MITSPDSKNIFNGNGSARSFSFAWKVQNPDDLAVYHVSSTGVETLLTYNTHYLVTLNIGQDENPGGMVTFPVNTGIAALPTGEKLVVTRGDQLTQPSDVPGSTLLEEALDKLTALTQQVQERINRTMAGGASDISSLSLGTAAQRANKVLTFDGSGNVSLATTVPDLTLSESELLAVLTANGLGTKFYPRTAAEIAAGVTPTNYQYPEFNVKRYGAMGDDATDDTAAIQTAFSVAIAAVSAEVVFPRGIYRHAALTLGPAAGQSNVNLIFEAGANNNGLKYIGSGGTALTIRDNTRYAVFNLRMVNAGSGTTIGLHITSLAAGSNTGPGVYINTLISGFTTDLKIGDSSDKAASEHTFISTEVTSATTGVLIEGSPTAINTLNIAFVGLFGSSCTTGYAYNGPPSAGAAGMSVKGGSFSNNTLDFDLTTPIALHLSDLFFDSGGYLIRCGPASPASGTGVEFNILLENFQTNHAAPPGGIIAKFHHAGRYTVRSCVLMNGGEIQIDGTTAAIVSVTVEDSTVNGAGAAPVTYTGNRALATIKTRNVGKSTAAPNTWWDDRHYLVNTAPTEFDLEPRINRSAGSTIVFGAMGSYTAADTTPSIWAVKTLVIANGAPTTITNLDDGYEKQEVTLKFSDANTTIQDGTNFQLSGGANFVSSADDTLTVVKVGSVWYEMARSIN